MSSPAYCPTDSEDKGTIIPTKSQPSIPIMDSSSNAKSFATEIQRFSKDPIKSLSNFKFSDELTDSNYTSWSQAVSELLQLIDLNSFILIPNYEAESMSNAENSKSRFIITIFLLNHLDSNNNLQARNHMSDPSDPQVLIYDPCKCWMFLKNRHAKITEAKLSALTKALYAATINRSESLSSYLDRFENIIREFFLIKGQISDQQSARMLMYSISSLSETTTELIHAQVNPLTRQGVLDYLRDYETRQGWTSPAMREANAASGTSSNPSKRTPGKACCSKDVCYRPHPEKECWSKPENTKKKEDFLARRQGTQLSLSHIQVAAAVKGRKKVSPPRANAAEMTDDFQCLSLHASFEDVDVATSCASAANADTDSKTV